MANVKFYKKGMLRVEMKKNIAELPHSCDTWVIGSKERAQDLVDDLKAFIAGIYVGPEDYEDFYDEEAWE